MSKKVVDHAESSVSLLSEYDAGMDEYRTFARRYTATAIPKNLHLLQSPDSDIDNKSINMHYNYENGNFENENLYSVDKVSMYVWYIKLCSYTYMLITN
jgi:hypothetical protein